MIHVPNHVLKLHASGWFALYLRYEQAGLWFELLEADLMRVATAAALFIWDIGPEFRARHASCALRFRGRPWSKSDATKIATALTGVIGGMERAALFDFLVIQARSELLAGSSADPKKQADAKAALQQQEQVFRKVVIKDLNG